ncbi:hypothetical protein Ae717Ps2_7131 [Pseudonocardia sp. Ae717_Ps2]|nr:hypothetical protein Ae717Ps2_7131 [Pseudonocardia sp. Ae717_Ps2]
MGWESSHLHKFTINDTCYGIPDPDWDPAWDLGDRTHDEQAVTLAQLFQVGQEADYVYDFGDNWHHTLTVTALTTAEPAVRYPRCIDGRGACPPEDVGGTTATPHSSTHSPTPTTPNTPTESNGGDQTSTTPTTSTSTPPTPPS